MNHADNSKVSRTTRDSRVTKEGMTTGRSWILVTAVAIGGVATCGAADVDLVWSPAAQTVLVGTVVEIDLYAVTDTGQEQTIAAIDVVLTWDPQRLLLLGVVDNGPYEWLGSGFDLRDFDGLNQSLLDGNAKYTALSALDDPAVAIPPTDEIEGLLVTTIQFFALSEVDQTVVVIEESWSATAVTQVFGGGAPNDPVTGELNNASVTIIRRPKTLRPRPASPSTTPLPGITNPVRRARSYKGTSDP